MKNAIVFSMIVLGLVGYLNLGGPQRLSLEDYHKIKHQSLTSVTQDAGGPERLALEGSDIKIPHHNLSSGAHGSVSLALDDGNRMK